MKFGVSGGMILCFIAFWFGFMIRADGLSLVLYCSLVIVMTNVDAI